jgi:hypothetical protein
MNLFWSFSMRFMDNSEFVARALRDYLRPLVGEAEVTHIDSDINAGEPDAGIFTGISIAQHFGIALPPIFREKIVELGKLPLNWDVMLLEDFDALPAFWKQAS